jgi:hypothetical protein
VRASRPRLTLLLAAVLLIGACDASGPNSQATTIAFSPTPSAVASTAPSASPIPSIAPGPSRTPAAASASPRPSTTVATTPPVATPGNIASCTGTDANRTFYASVAAKASWDVYCPSLPAGWFVEKGSFSGGLLTIAYKAANGLRLELKEGAVCSGTPSSCGPLDSTIGPALFGDRQGQLGRLAGNLVLYVSPGQNPAWQATGIGLDEPAFRSFTGAFVKVPG